MISRRLFLGFSLAGLAAGCQTTTGDTATSTQTPVTAPTTANASGSVSMSDVRIVDVDVSFVDHITQSGRSFDYPKDGILAEVKKAMLQELTRANPSGGTPVKAEVTVLNVFIANGATGVLLGSSASSITAKTRLFRTDNGALVGRGMDVSGSSGARPTILGAAAIKTPEQEIKLAAADLAKKTKRRIYDQKS